MSDQPTERKTPEQKLLGDLDAARDRIDAIRSSKLRFGIDSALVVLNAAKLRLNGGGELERSDICEILQETFGRHMDQNQLTSYVRASKDRHERVVKDTMDELRAQVLSEVIALNAPSTG